MKSGQSYPSVQMCNPAKPLWCRGNFHFEIRRSQFDSPVQIQHHNLRWKLCVVKTRWDEHTQSKALLFELLNSHCKKERNPKALNNYLMWNLKFKSWIESTMCTSRGLFSMTTIMSWQESDSKSVSNPSKE